MGEDRNGMRRPFFRGWVALLVLLAALQSAAHLAVVLGADRVGTLVDLDHSNGVPDLVSTAALAGGVLGAVVLAWEGARAPRAAAATVAVVLLALTVADLLHDGPHPASTTGWFVIVVVVGAGVLLMVLAASAHRRTRATLAAGGFFLVGSFLVNGLDQFDRWFERTRGDPITEYQIVTKEGLELLGWSLVALALWDEALRRRVTATSATAPASRARAASRRRVA